MTAVKYSPSPVSPPAIGRLDINDDASTGAAVSSSRFAEAPITAEAQSHATAVVHIEVTEIPDDLVTLVVTTNAARKFTAPRSLLATQLPLFGVISRAELSILPSTTEDDVALMVQFLCQGTYADGEYPAIGPDEVIAMSDAEVAAELAKPEGLDLNEALEVDPRGLEGGWTPKNDRHGMDIYDGDEEEDGSSDSGDDSDSDSDMTGGENLRAQGYGMATEYPPSLRTSLRMYQLAVSVGLPRLQLLARRRLHKSAVRHIMHADFMFVVDAVFSAPPTPSTNPPSPDIFEPLRDSLCILAAWRYVNTTPPGAKPAVIAPDEESFRQGLRQLMAKHEYLMEGVLHMVVDEGDLNGNRVRPSKINQLTEVYQGLWGDAPWNQCPCVDGDDDE